MKEEVLIVKKGSGTLEKGLNTLGEDLEQLEDNFEELQQTVENIDNNLRKNNIRIKGVKEGVEGNDLKSLLKEVFSACLGTDWDISLQISSAFQVGGRGRSLLPPRDIIVKFPSWYIKPKVLENIWEHSGLAIGGAQVSVYCSCSK